MLTQLLGFYDFAPNTVLPRRLLIDSRESAMLIDLLLYSVNAIQRTTVRSKCLTLNRLQGLMVEL